MGVLMRKIIFLTAFFAVALVVQNTALAQTGAFISSPADFSVTGYTGPVGTAAAPAGTERIEFSAASPGVERISTLILPASVTAAAGLLFCPALAEILVDAQNTALKSLDGVLYTSDMTCLVAYPRAKRDAVFHIPETVKTVRANALADNPYLEEVVFPTGLMAVETGNFTGCTRLKTLKVPEENRNYMTAAGLLYTKDGSVLELCPAGITGAVAVRPGTQVIGYGAFAGCAGVTAVDLPDSLRSIMTMAFSGCTGLTSVTLPDQLESINGSCFSGCTALAAIITESADRFRAVDGILYSRDMLDLICCPPGKSGSVAVPAGVRNIQNGAFDGCTEITQIQLPDSVENVGRAFLNCSKLRCFQIPESQSILDYCMFMGCTDLEWVYLPCNVVIIQDQTFAGCSPVIYCDPDSYAEMYAIEHNLEYRYMIHVILNGEKLWFDQPPALETDTVLVPLRSVFEAFGAAVGWNGKTKTASIKSGDTQLEISADSWQMQVAHGEAAQNVSLSTPAKIVGDRMLVPLRAVSEALQAKVGWDIKTNTVEIEK